MQHPGPIHPLVNLRRETLNLFIVKKTATGQHPAQKYAGINWRHFGIQDALPGLAVHEVVEKAMLLLNVAQRKAQRDAHAVAYRVVLFPSSAGGDAQRA